MVDGLRDELTVTNALKRLTLSEVKPDGSGKELGCGTYGRVFTVKYCGRIFAAKEIRSILLKHSGREQRHAIRKSFLQECYHCSKLRHPNIVQFIGVFWPGQQSELPVMIMELMECNLTTFIDKRPKCDLKIKYSILCDVAYGLVYLHAQEPTVIHRDLSPNNVLMTSQFEAKIGDLGVAKALHARGKQIMKTKLTKLPGMIDFMPPEAFVDNPVYDSSLDVFSFGGITLFVMTEKWPTPLAATEFDSRTRQVIGFTEAERRLKYLSQLDKEWRDLVENCLDNDPAQRPAMSQVLEKIKTFKEKIAKENIAQKSSATENEVLKKDTSLMPISILIKAKSNLKIKVRHAKILFCGAPQTGKTSFINFLKNVKLDECQSSGLSLTSERVIIKEKQWIDLHSQLEIKELVKHLFHQAQGDFKLDESDLSLQKTGMLNEMVDVEQEMIASFTNIPEGEVSETWNILTLLDVGCQPELINMLSAINDSAAVTFVVLNISEGINCLDLPVDIPNKNYRKCKTNHSNAYLLKCLLSLIMESSKQKALFPKVMQLHADQPSKPIVCFLGTFCDLLKKSLQSGELFDDVIITLSNKIYDLIRTINSDNSLHIWSYEGEVLIPFDKTLSGENQHEHIVAKELRSKIFDDVLQVKQPYEIPFTWFILELQLRSEKKVCLSLNEINVISDKIMPDDNKIDIKEFLRFYHLLGVLLYFEVDHLDDFVITDPQWLYNNLKKLVTCEFAEKTILDEKLDDFRYKGIFHESLLNAFDLDTQGIRKKYFLDLLVYLKVCVPYINNTNSYYMPSALPTCKWSSKQSALHENTFGKQIFYTKDKDNCYVVEPLCIQFSIHTIPRGMFCWLVVQLKKENSKWILYPNEPGTENFKQCDNLVTFRMNSGFHYLSLIDKVYYIEMQVRTKHFEPSEAFFEAQNAVTTGIKSICGKFNKQITDLQYGFLCTCSNINTEHLTLLLDIHIPNKADCGYQMLELTPSHKVWFSSLEEMLSLIQQSHSGKGHVVQTQPPQGIPEQVSKVDASVAAVDAKLKERPTHRMLSQVSNYLVPNWSRIGYQLLDPQYVKNIESTTKRNADKCHDMLMQWLETDTSATYSKLLDVLYLLDLPNTAEQIKEKFCKTS